MDKSEDIKDLAVALSKAQGEMKGAHKDSDNPFFKSKYADLASVWDAIRAPFAKHGLSVTQLPSEDDRGLVLETVLMHSSGQWISSKLRINPVKADPQSLGSALSYSRRYALSAIAGVYQEDDDANLASDKQPNPVMAPKATKPKAPSGIPPEINKPDPRLGNKGDHDHAWKPSNFKGEGGEAMEYCIVCKIKRPVDLDNDPELPF